MDRELGILLRLAGEEGGEEGGEEESSDSGKKTSLPPRWQEFVDALFEGGKKKVKNPKRPEQGKPYKKQVSFSTAMKDKSFQKSVWKRYKRWDSLNKKKASSSVLRESKKRVQKARTLLSKIEREIGAWENPRAEISWPEVGSLGHAVELLEQVWYAVSAGAPAVHEGRNASQVDLANAVVRLAHEKPEFREDLLPLLREASMDSYDVVKEGPYIRISMDIQKDVIHLEELPGKPLKRKVRFVVADMRHSSRWGGNRFLAANLFEDAKLSPRMTFDQALKALKGAFAAAVKDTGADVTDPFYVSTRNYLEVTPTDASPIEMQVDGNHLLSKWTEFVYTISYGDDPYEPSYSKYVSSSPASARKLYKILKANPDALKGEEFVRFLTKNQIKYKVVNSVWR